MLAPYIFFGNVAGPLVMWLLKRKGSPAVDQQGRAALNFQISMTLYFAMLYVISVIGEEYKLSIIENPAYICLRAWEITNLWFIIQAALKVGKGEAFQYPLSIRFIPTKV